MIQRTRKPAHTINMAFTICIFIGVLALFTHYEITQAETPYGVAPRLYNNCQQSFIGNEYSEARRPVCQRLWGIWSREIMLDGTIYFSKF